MLDGVPAAERGRNADEAGDDRADRQRHQRERHWRRRLVWAVPRAVVAMTATRVIVRLGGTMRHLLIVFVRAPVRVPLARIRGAVPRPNRPRPARRGPPRGAPDLPVE